jgi:hypothetical protein
MRCGVGLIAGSIGSVGLIASWPKNPPTQQATYYPKLLASFIPTLLSTYNRLNRCLTKKVLKKESSTRPIALMK